MVIDFKVCVYKWHLVGKFSMVKTNFSVDFLPLFVFLYITQIRPLFFISNWLIDFWLNIFILSFLTSTGMLYNSYEVQMYT